MTIEEMKQKKREKGYSYAQIAELSGVPLGTVQKVFSGETANPRYDTLMALEELFADASMTREAESYGISAMDRKDGLREPGCAADKRPGEYTVEDYRTLPEERRVELIDGYFYDMAAPTPVHQQIAGEIYRQIANFVLDRGGDCLPFISPVDVQLDSDEKTMLQPDIVILCDRDKIRSWGLYGAPEFVLEVVSPSSRRKDYTKKLAKYIDAGVREYWLVDPYQKRLIVYFFESEEYAMIYGLNQPVPIRIYGGELEIQFERIEKWIEEFADIL